MQAERKRPVSIDEAVKYLIHRSKKGKTILDLTGSWSMTEEEAGKLKASIGKAWETWKT
ncbi:hypothetical protein GX563_09130 [Candidatus Bathyarchaeota archaeon]|nr:hypothetical protein [Candidatus Bathyarchaeota archaeon]